MDNEINFKIDADLEYAKQQLYIFGNKQQALDIITSCMQYKSGDPKIWSLLGNAYLINKDFEMSIICFETALELSPNLIEASCGLAWYYSEIGRFKTSRQILKKTLNKDKDATLPKFYLSMIEKLIGNYEEGYEMYESRDKLRWLKKYSDNNLDAFKKIPELKKNIHDLQTSKRILVISEQGYGDQIMYARYIRELKKLGHSITFIVNEKLHKIFKDSDDFKNILLKTELSNDLISSTDYLCYLMSLPFILKQKVSYINPPSPINLKVKNSSEISKKLSEVFTKKLNDNKKLKIGIAWSGRPSQPRELFRSISSKILDDYLSFDDVDFYSLQQLNGDDNLSFISNKRNFIDCSEYINSFYDTAYFVDKMDFIITTCTSLVHLSGSMNKETFLLLSRIPDFRWGLRNSQSWYPSVKLLRQKKLNNWNFPLYEINRIIKERNEKD